MATCSGQPRGEAAGLGRLPDMGPSGGRGAGPNHGQAVSGPGQRAVPHGNGGEETLGQALPAAHKAVHWGATEAGLFHGG